MANEPKILSVFLAKNLIALRRQRGLSQGQLAKIAGIPRSTLTHLESGEGNPSLQLLAKVTAGMQVSIEELLSRPRASCKLIKSSDVPRQNRGQGLAVLFKLLPDLIPGMELDRLELLPGARMGGVPHVPNSKEYSVCIRGVVQIAVGGIKYNLQEGDVLAFPGDQAHSYFNLGSSKSACISVVVIAPQGT